MSENHGKQPNNKDSFEENLRDILSGDDECSPQPQKTVSPKPSAASKTQIENHQNEPEKKYLFLFSLIRVAAFLVMVGLLVMFVCRTME